MQKRNLVQQILQAASYTTTNAYANVTGYSITVLEDGIYDINCSCNTYQNTDGDTTLTRMAKGGNILGGINSESFLAGGTGTVGVRHVIFAVPLKAADIITLQAMYNGGTATEIRAEGLGHFQIIKRGV